MMAIPCGLSSRALSDACGRGACAARALVWTHVPAPATNATVVKVCRRLVQATAERRFEIRWVKVKGHSGDEGNNAADVAAGWAQNGGTKGEKDIEGLMQRLRMDGGTDDDG